MSENSQTICLWGSSTLGDASSIMTYAQRAKTELDELIEAIDARQSDNEILAEAADVTILLHRLAGTLGTDLSEAVNTKMQINRKRKWSPSNDGTGNHVKG